MTLYIFSLNDIELRIYRDNLIVASEPGFALIERADNQFGESARKQIKQNPRQVNSAFWHRMNLDPLSFAGAKTSNHADLLYQQLCGLIEEAQIGPQDELVVLVRSNTSNEQLSLLLGVCNECNLCVTGLVDLSVVLLSMHSACASNLVLDSNLQSLTIGEVNCEQSDHNKMLSKKSGSELNELGLLPLMDAWLAIIADHFISDVRFDPLRIADTEQQVFNQVYNWVAEPNRSEKLKIEVHYQDITRSIEINEAVLIDKARQRYDLLLRKIGSKKNIWLTEHAAKLPGFQASLSHAGHTVMTLDQVNPFQAVLAQLPDIVCDVDQIQFVTALKAARPSSVTEVTDTSVEVQTSVPTHLLFNGFALALPQKIDITLESFRCFAVTLPGKASDYPIVVSRSAGKVEVGLGEESNWRLNQHKIQSNEMVGVGDVLMLDDKKLAFIRVEDGT